MTQPNICPRRRGFRSSPVHHWSVIFLEIRHQFHTSILLSNWINQSVNVNLKPKRCVLWIYVMLFQSSDTFIRNLFQVRLPYLLLIRSVPRTKIQLIISLLMSPLLGTGIPHGLHIRRTGHNPPRGGNFIYSTRRTWAPKRCCVCYAHRATPIRSLHPGTSVLCLRHLQPINGPYAGHRPSLWITHKEWAITHHAGPVRVSG
jgi:hypothetical protein